MTPLTAKAPSAHRHRRIAYRTRGRSHGSVTRLASPCDAGELIKPFVFLDYFDIDPRHTPPVGFRPQSGVAALTLLLEGRISYEDAAGTRGLIEPGGVEWIGSAGGLWQAADIVGTERARGYQLWIALAPEMDGLDPGARYLGGESFVSHGPARVILGRHGDAASRIPAPPTINYLDVSLKRGEKWRYEPPKDHTVRWVAVHAGRLNAPQVVEGGELAVFEASNEALDFAAAEDTGFVLGSAVKHPHELVLGSHW